MFYLNAWYLVPRLVFRKKYFYYGIIVLLLSGCVYFLQPFDNLLGHNLLKNKSINTQQAAAPSMATDNQSVTGVGDSSGPKNLPFGPLPHQDLRMEDPRFKSSNRVIFIHQSGNIDMVGLFIFIVVMGLSVAVSTVQKWQLTEQVVVKAKAEKANAELSFLKAQINPHFLFNTLNNIYALSVTNSEHTSESIMKLSNIMRYVTDDVTENFVSLQSEVDCIHDYIDLQKLRLGIKTHLDFTSTGDFSHKKIAPLVLMTFIENVFKYGISNHKTSAIIIRVTAEGDKLRLFCQNTIFDKDKPSTRKGIGINNTKQRLQLIYPDRHKLDVKAKDSLFTVNLEIDC